MSSERLVALPWVEFLDTDFKYFLDAVVVEYREVIDNGNGYNFWFIYYSKKIKVYYTDYEYLWNNFTFKTLNNIKNAIDTDAKSRGYTLINNIDLINLL